MSDFVTETQHTIHIKAEKPIAGVFYIRDKYLDRAKKYGKKLVIEFNGEKYVCTYREWMKKAKRMKKEFLIPGVPMILYGQYIARFKQQTPEEHVENVMNTIAQMPERYRLQIRASLGLK